MNNPLQKLFSKPKTPAKLERAEILSGGQAVFSPFSGDAYQSDIYRAAVDAIARNASKLKASHVITLAGQRKPGDGHLNRILQTRPNPCMSAYDLLYKITTHYYLHNNSFAYLQKDDRGVLQAIWPLRPQYVEFQSDPTGELYVKFLFTGGQTVTLPYSDVCHIRRHFNQNDLLGDANTAIQPALDLAHAQSAGQRQAILSGGTIRGLLKFNQVLSPDRLKAERDAFIADYLTVANNGGIASLDTKADYIPLESSPVAIDEKQLIATKRKIYEYLGISEKIVNSTYSEKEWAAFYESVVEPLAVQLSLELTSKVFTAREQAFGNSILFEANRLQFSSAASKTTLLRELVPLGLLTINQALEILNLPSVADGDRRLQTLNVVNAAKADKYQLDEGGNGSEGD